MSSLEDHERRIVAIEAELTTVRQESVAARALAAGADRDVADSRAELRAHTRTLNALRETQLEQGLAISRLDGRIGRLDGRIGGLVDHVDGLNGRIGGLVDHVDGVNGRIGGLVDHVDGLNGRIGRLDSRVNQIIDLVRQLIDRDSGRE